MKRAGSAILAMMMILALAGCGKSASGSGSNDGYEEGRMGDTMHTYFFDYTVESAYVCDDFEGYTADAGNQILVAEVTVKNTHKESIEMYDTDFQAQWGDDGDDDYEVPITYDGTDTAVEPLTDEQLPGIYDLGVNESRTGLLVFEVPEGKKDFSISYMEAFDDDSTGTTYFVYFTAEEQ